MKLYAYLDIETTGFSPYNNELTVIGIHLDYGNDEVMQFIGGEICASKLIKIIKKVNTLYTFNGARFDLPFISKKLRVDLTEYCQHLDLLDSCRQRNLSGGLKEVEKKFGIKRKLTNIDGRLAVKLWHNYTFNNCEDSLRTLLAYNKEDVLNLKRLRQKLRL